ncbi:hypothetical protein Bca4012_098578 [Brassica carinata]
MIIKTTMHSRLIWLEDCPFRCCLKHCCLMELSLSHLPKASMGQSHLCCLVLALDTLLHVIEPKATLIKDGGTTESYSHSCRGCR